MSCRVSPLEDGRAAGGRVGRQLSVREGGREVAGL